MKLAELIIKNLGCIVENSFKFFDYTTLIGPNNSGKSTILRALEIFLNQEKPDFEEWNENHQDDPIVLEGLFTDILERERDIPGIASLVYNAQIRLRLTITKGDKGAKLSYEAFTREENITGWADGWNALSEEIREIANSIGINGQSWRNIANKERIREHIRREREELIQYSDAGWTDEGTSITQALQQALPRVEIIPAVKDAKDEQQLPQKKNIFKEILDQKIYPEIERTDEYTRIMTETGNLSNKLKSDGEDGIIEINNLAEEISSRTKGFLDLKILFRLDTPDIKKIIGNSAKIRPSDGTETPVQLQGHGAQRTLIYALIDYIASQRAYREDCCRPVMLLFEEPGLYIHPQLLRCLRTSLIKVSKRDQ